MIKKIDENPVISDQVIFDILTPFPNVGNSVDECYNANPYKVDNVTIYFLERNFVSTNFGEYNAVLYDEDIKKQLDEAKAEACATTPTQEQLDKIINLNNELQKTVKVNKVYYKDAIPVATFGTSDFPAWLSTDIDNALITNVPLDEEDNVQYGHFELEWDTTGQREGDYFICWTYSPYPAGDTITKHDYFGLLGNTKITTTIPTHVTNPKKYETLFERYLPELYKMKMSETDLTPEVLHEYNAASAKLFTFLEDFVNQIIDLLDANVVPESILPLLASGFGLKLRSNDSTLWRRQIKNAIPLFKQKGTYNGLKTALAQAGIELKKLTQLWQIISNYTWQEAFYVTSDAQTEFTLSKMAILPLDVLNTEVYFRGVNDTEWTQLTSDYIDFGTITDLGCDGQRTQLIWLGGDLSINPIILNVGDWIRVVYKINEVPNPVQQTIEDYIRTLSLADQRDERDQIYPLKNWNVRVLEEDDPLFGLIITDKHPFHDPVIFGKVRTEFAYSENVYNMEEYNGSTRDSTDPCDIDRTFIDPCKLCLGSKFNLDLDIEQLSDDRIKEVQEIINDYSPFHAVLHSINLNGLVDEVMQPQIEEITALVNVEYEEYMITNGEMIFNRSMSGYAQFRRDALATMSTPVVSASGTAYNTIISLFSPDTELVYIDSDPTLTLLEVMSPSVNAGTYQVQKSSLHYAELVPPFPTEPLNETSFTFRLSMERIQKALSNIYQDNLKTFNDDVINLGQYSIKSQWDVDNDPSYTGGVWQIQIGINTYDILNILPNGRLELYDPTNLLPNINTTGLTYSLLDDSAATIASSLTGNLFISARARVEMTGTILVRGASAVVDDLRNVIEANDYAKIGLSQYQIIGFVPNQTHQFYIDDYTGGSSVGTSVIVYRRIVSSGIGNFGYSGLKLTTIVNHETGLDIQNGANPPLVPVEDNKFKENFLVLIGTKYYAISEIDGTDIMLSGPMQTWTTLGTAVVYDIKKFTKISAVVPDRDSPPMDGYEFDFIDRRGNDVIEKNIEIVSPMLMASTLNNNDQFMDSVQQRESIGFIIEYDDGTISEGSL